MTSSYFIIKYVCRGCEGSVTWRFFVPPGPEEDPGLPHAGRWSPQGRTPSGFGCQKPKWKPRGPVLFNRPSFTKEGLNREEPANKVKAKAYLGFRISGGIFFWKKAEAPRPSTVAVAWSRMGHWRPLLSEAREAESERFCGGVCGFCGFVWGSEVVLFVVLFGFVCFVAIFLDT